MKKVVLFDVLRVPHPTIIGATLPLKYEVSPTDEEVFKEVAKIAQKSAEDFKAAFSH